MKKMMLLVSCMLMQTVFAADLSGNLIFEADYRTGSAVPKVAKGSPAATVIAGEAPEFSKDGLVIGKGKASLRYNAAGNLSNGSGAIEVLFENTALDWNDRTKLIIVQCIGKELTFYLYKHSTDGLGAHFTNRAGERWKAFPRAVAKRLGDKKFYHVVINYSNENVQCFVDGKLMRSIKVANAPGAFGKYFSVGPGGANFGRDAVGTLAKIAAYNRPLTAAEIAELAKAQ